MEKTVSPTLLKLKHDAETIMAKGIPFSKDDLKVLNIYNRLNGGKAGNAGKRNRKAENARLIKGDKTT